MPNTDGPDAVRPIHEDPSSSDSGLVARATSLHEQFMRARPGSAPPARTDVMRDSESGDADICMYDRNDVLVARYRWDSKRDNMRKVSLSDPKVGVSSTIPAHSGAAS